MPTYTHNGLTFDSATGALVVSGGGAASPTIEEHFDALPSAITAISGTSLTGLSASSGQLASGDTNNHEFLRDATLVSDARHLLKITPSGGFTTAMYLKWINATNYLVMQYAGGASGQLYGMVGGVGPTQLTTFTIPSTTLKQWWVARVTGNRVKVEAWLTDPRLGGVAEQSAGYTLAGGDATALGDGVSGQAGLRLTGAGGTGATATKLDDWLVVPTSGVPVAQF